MEKRLFVGNLPHELSDAEVVAIFREHGAVVSAVVIRDRDTGHSRGFAFVEMATGDEAAAAASALNGTKIGSRTLRVEEARPHGRRRFNNRESP